MKYLVTSFMSIFLSFGAVDTMLCAGKAVKNSVECKKMLVAGAAFNKLHQEVFTAIQAGDALHLEQLIAQCPAVVNAVNSYGQTPLLWACMLGKQEVAVRLIELGANVHVCDADQVPVLTWAIKKHMYLVIKMVIARGADVNYVHKNGMTPLMYAGVQDDLYAVELLLEAGAHIYVKDHAKRAVYHYLSFYIITKKLLKDLADMKIRHRVYIDSAELSCLQAVAVVDKEWKSLYEKALQKSTLQQQLKSLVTGNEQ